MVVWAASTDFVEEHGGGGGVDWGGLWGKGGQWGVRVEEVPRG